MQSKISPWHQICQQISEREYLDEDMKSRIREIQQEEHHVRIKHETEVKKRIFPFVEGLILPDYGMETFQKRRSRGDNGLLRFPHYTPPLACDPDFTFINQQDGDYTLGLQETETVIDFEENNKPTKPGYIVSFTHQASLLSIPATGEISMGGVAGYGSIPHENIFPGKGTILYSGFTHIFKSDFIDPNFAVLQATARLSHPNQPYSTAYLDAGPLGTQFDGLVGTCGILNMFISTYDPTTGHYHTATSYHIFEREVKIGSWYNTAVPIGLFPHPQSFLQRYSDFETVDVIDLPVKIRYKHSPKPIIVGAAVELYIIIGGSEKNSGGLINCQKSGTTSLTLPQGYRFPGGSPFKVESIRLCAF